jgi:hypothetical protein
MAIRVAQDSGIHQQAKAGNDDSACNNETSESTGDFNGRKRSIFRGIVS